MARARLKKDAEPMRGQQPLFPKERLNDMPLAKGRVAKCEFIFGAVQEELRLNNLEEPLVWKMSIPRLTKADPETLARTFDAEGSRHMRAFKDVPAAPEFSPTAAASTVAAAIDGNAEFGLQTDDHKEYFLSKFGDLVGIVTVKRTASGWSAGIGKSNVPRVLSKEAVDEGLMPPAGHSALPKSLEAVVPMEYQYWKAQGDDARQIRDAFVESGFFSDDCIKAVDGELRKVEVKYFLYESPTIEAGKRVEKVIKHEGSKWNVYSEDGSKKLGSYDTKADAVERLRQIEGHKADKSLSDHLNDIIPLADMVPFTPMAEPGDWLENLDAVDALKMCAVLSPPDRTISPREMVRAAKTLKGEFLLEHNDTRMARAAFASAGRVFKVRGLNDRVFVASFPVSGVAKLDDGPVVKTVDFQGIKIDIDRPAGFVQTGKDEQGNDWSRTYLYDYGFFPGTKGGDGDQLDVFVGPDSSAASAYWVTQKKADGSFDEYKVFVGFPSERDALDAYQAHIPTRFFDAITEVPIGALKGLLGIDPVTLEKRLFQYVRKIEGVSFDQIRTAVNAALQEAFPPDEEGNCCAAYGYYCDDLFDDHAIYYNGGKYYSVNYTFTDGKAQLTSQPVEVKRVTTYEPVSGGAPAPGPTAGAMPEKRMKRAADELSKRTLRIALAKDQGPAADEHYVLGIVLEPDVIDAQNDTYSAGEVRQASERFMEQHRNMGLMHKQKVNDKVQILENFIAPVDMQIGDETVKKGTWLMGVRVKDPTLWKSVKNGELTGFSIGGSAIRKPVEEGV